MLRSVVCVVALCLALAGCDGSEPRNGEPGVERPTITVVAVNLALFEPGDPGARIHAFARAIAEGRVPEAPDVIVTEETARRGIAELQSLLNGALDARYRVVGPTGAENRAKLLVDARRNEVTGVATFVSPCSRDYVLPTVRLEHRETGTPYSVTGVHIRYDTSTDCKVRAIHAIRTAAADAPGVAVAAGDFNQRPVADEKECDPQERSAPLEWWTAMTSSSDIDGASWADAVLEATASSEAMAQQWTREATEPVELCTGATGFRRVRIDYVFVREESSMQVVAASADHPGWAGAQPGTTRCEPSDRCMYSDHRFVWAEIRL